MKPAYRDLIMDDDIKEAAEHFQRSETYIANIVNGFRSNYQIEAFVLNRAIKRTANQIRAAKRRLAMMGN